MARKPLVLPLQQRQALLNAAPLVSDFAGIEEVGVELTFSDPEGKQNPSPRRVSFEPHMHAYFQFGCPMRECTGGGFDAGPDLQRALTKRQDGHRGKLSCGGVRQRGGFKNVKCNIELHYTLSLRTAPVRRASRA